MPGLPDAGRDLDFGGRMLFLAVFWHMGPGRFLSVRHDERRGVSLVPACGRERGWAALWRWFFVGRAAGGARCPALGAGCYLVWVTNPWACSEASV